MRSILSTLLLLAAAAVYSGDIIRNGNFEKGMKDWSVWHKGMDRKYVKITYDDASDNKSLTFIGDPSYELNKILNCNQPYLKLEPDTKYYLTGRILSKNPGVNPLKRVQATIIERTDKGKIAKEHSLYLPWSQAKGAWYNFKIPFITSNISAKYYQIVLYARYLDKGEKIYIDDLAIIRDDPVKSKLSAKSYLEQVAEKAKTRIRAANRTYVFARTQLKYNLGRNYLHWWNDRPLFADRSLRGNIYRNSRLKEESFLKEIEVLKLYGMDGFSALTCSAEQTANYIKACNVADEKKVQNFLLMPEFYGGNLVKYYEPALERTIVSDHVFRVNHRAIIGSYAATSWPPVKWGAFLAKMREKYSENFLFVADIRKGAAVSKYQESKVTIDEIRDDQQRIRDYLDICDGVMFGGTKHLRFYYSDNSYGDPVNTDYLKNYLVPVMRSVLAEKEYKGKLFGLSVALGYVNPFSGSVKRQSGTRALRETMEIAADASPDFIECTEWNEFTENSGFQPSLAKSFAIQRILRYYCRKMRNLPPSPNPNDNPAIPNLIYSCRRTAMLGEKIGIELLNVPDTLHDELYSIELKLKNGVGDVVKTFPKINFNKNQLEARTFYIDTAKFAAYQTLIPNISVSKGSEELMYIAQGLPFLRLIPSWNMDYLTVSQPLRDVCRLRYNLRWRTRKGRITFTGAASTRAADRNVKSEPEKISSLEILEDGSEKWALDPKDEFKYGKYTIFRMAVSSPDPTLLRGKLLIYGVSNFLCRAAGNEDLEDFKEKPGLPNIISGNNDVALEMTADSVPRFIYICVPTSQLDKATIELRSNQGSFHLKAMDLVNNQVWANSFKGRCFVRMDYFNKLPDLPYPINKNKVEFECGMQIDRPFPVYALRIVTDTGNIFRSNPFMPKQYSRAAKVALRVYSEMEKKAVTVQIPKAAILDLKYNFDPKYGDMILAEGAPEWSGELGGGLLYGQPFYRGSGYPPKVNNGAPRRFKTKDTWALKFDGVGNYISFPPETLPRSSFTLDFDIRPTRGNDMVLFRTFSQHTKFFSLIIKKGQLYAAYIPKSGTTQYFETKLSVPYDSWAHIQVKNDIDKIVFSVNDKYASFPINGRPLYFGALAFAGPVKPGIGVPKGTGFFKGLLRNLRIVHK